MMIAVAFAAVFGCLVGLGIGAYVSFRFLAYSLTRREYWERLYVDYPDVALKILAAQRDPEFWDP